MTQEAFKAWWYNEGSQAPYTHHDCEEHTMRMCEIAWANGAYKEREALAQTQEPVCPECKAVVLYECVACSSNNYPPQRTWVGLNDDEIDYLIHLAYTGDEEFVQTIEAKLKEKNT